MPYGKKKDAALEHYEKLERLNRKIIDEWYYDKRASSGSMQAFYKLFNAQVMRYEVQKAVREQPFVSIPLEIAQAIGLVGGGES